MLPDKLYSKKILPCVIPANSWNKDTSVQQVRNRSVHFNILKNNTYHYPEENEKIEHRNIKSSGMDYVSNTRLQGLKAISSKMRDTCSSEENLVTRPFPFQKTVMFDLKTKKRESSSNSIIAKRKLKTSSTHNLQDNDIKPSPRKDSQNTKPTNIKENDQKTSVFTSKSISSEHNKPPKTPIGHNKRKLQDVVHKPPANKLSKTLHESQLNHYRWNDFQIPKKFTPKKSVQQNLSKGEQDIVSLNNKINMTQAPVEKYNPPPIRINEKWMEKEHQLNHSSNNRIKLFKHSDLREDDASFSKEKNTKLSTDMKNVVPFIPRGEKNMEQQIYRVVLGDEKVNLNKIVSDLFERNENNVIVITKNDQFNQLVSKTSSMDYIKFAEEITTDIIVNEMYSDTSIKDVFKKHFQLNRDLLDEDKMTAEITALKAALNITESNNSLTDDNESNETMSQITSQKSEDVNHLMEVPPEANNLSRMRYAKSSNSILLQEYELDFRSKETKNAYLKYRDIKKEEMKKLLSKQQSIIRVFMNANISDDSNHSRIDETNSEGECDTGNEISTTDITNDNSTTEYDEETDQLGNSDENIELNESTDYSVP